MSIGNPFRNGAFRSQRGLAAVEMAIVLPLLLFLLLAVAELGRAFYQYNTLSKSVRDAARYIADRAINGAGIVDVTPYLTETRNLVVYGSPVSSGASLLPGLSTGNVTVTAVNSTQVKVSATYVYQPLFTNGIPRLVGGGGKITVTLPAASTTMVAL